MWGKGQPRNWRSCPGGQSLLVLSLGGAKCLPETLKRIKSYEKFKELPGFSSLVIEQISFNNSTFIRNKDLDNFKYF